MEKKGVILTGAITLSLVLSGCFQGEQSLEQEEIDPPQDAEAVDNLEETTTDKVSESATTETEEGMDEEETVTDMVPRELYLLDKNGMVAAQTLELPNTESNEVATQVLEYLVDGGPVSSLLPNGFQAVFPEGTEILGLNLKEDGTMIVDVSEEFKNYESEDEVKILEAMTFTLTQFDNVDRVQLWINGHQQDVMPVNGTPIGNGYSKADGINVVQSDVVDLLNSQAVTMYYPAEHNENRYYVPVTQYVEKNEENMYKSIVQTLLKGPGYDASVLHVFNMDTMLTSEPKVEDGVLNLMFSEEILKDSEQSIIADEVMETLVRTLTEQEGVEAVNIKVENVDQLVSENGETYDKPVTRDSLTPTEKL
ncbi:GerMN domain-containing protein [Oceanobacillus halophilus]|uniref:Spore gernimation protein n=1 Tax=Oceanobacillus halophilus TaxID=930130 RepID=A0A495AHA9_9BACI|nr:GerMN domain-containing protein [Oceanobacillus halophilus]RKQ37935.1 spore gernimation protein [Oceanobacillus halophilus]